MFSELQRVIIFCRNIEDDLAKLGEGNFRQNRRRSEEQPREEWQRSFPDFQENDEFVGIEQNMMHQLEDMMNSFFGGFQMHNVIPNFPQIEGNV